MVGSGSTQVLSVEDDEIDVEIALRQFRRSNFAAPVMVAKNGEEGLNRLREISRELSEHLDLVVLLDLNMPLMNGHEFLAEVRRDESLKRVVIFVLTTSGDVRDTSAAYDRNVAGYIVKSGFDKMERTLPELLELYLKFNSFPPKHR